MQALSPANIRRYAERHVAPVIAGLFATIRAGKCAELRSQLCNQVPGRSMMSMMGMPPADETMVQRLVTLHETTMVYLGAFRLLLTGRS